MKFKKAVSILNCISIIFCVIAQCFIPVTVCALSMGGLQSTIASIIISLLLECGAAPVNNAWLQSLNSSYGVTSSIGTIQDCINSGLLTETTSGLVDTGLSYAIESAPAYSELGLAEIFTTSVDDVAMGVAAGSGAVNLANVAINVGTAGTIGIFAGAAAVGVGLGVLVNHLWDLWKNGPRYEMPLSEILKINDQYILEGGQYYVRQNRDHLNWAPGFLSIPYGVVVVGFGDSSHMVKNLNSETATWYRRAEGTIEQNPVFEYNLDPNGIGQSNVGSAVIWNPQFYPKFSNNTQARSYLNSLNQDDIKNTFVSPDIIGTNGNYNTTYNPESGYTDIDETPVVPDGYDFKPVDMNDYLNYADDANQNTEDGNIDEIIQGEEFDNLIDNLLVEPSIIPDQGVTDPEVPDRPIIPDQPVTPAKDPITGEQQSEVLEGITTPDLRSVFPFCIPFDLYNILGVMKYEGREAPLIVWNFEILGNTYPVIIDLSPYEDVASLLRLLELLAFIVGLAVATRKLIGAGG